MLFFYYSYRHDIPCTGTSTWIAMFFPLIDFLKKDLNAFISSIKGVKDDYVLVTNLNNITEGQQSADKKIIISIANIEEEKMLKTPENYIRVNNEINYKKPPVWLNLICLITYYSKSSENYDGIDLLAYVVQYFQSKPRLDQMSAFVAGSFPPHYEDVRVEFLSLNYEQTNYLWGLFGGKYYPSVLYKFRTIPVDHEELTPGGPAIQMTDVNALHKK